MRIDDISTYLYTQQIGKMQETATKGTEETKVNEDGKSFAELLKSTVSDYSEMKSMASVLDKSVLGNVFSEKDLASFSEDLLGSSSGRKVISELAEGHLNAIVLTDNKDEGTKIENSLDSYSEAVSETDALAGILDKLNGIAANGASGKE